MLKSSVNIETRPATCNCGESPADAVALRKGWTSLDAICVGSMRGAWCWGDDSRCLSNGNRVFWKDGAPASVVSVEKFTSVSPPDQDDEINENHDDEQTHHHDIEAQEF